MDLRLAGWLAFGGGSFQLLPNEDEDERIWDVDLDDDDERNSFRLVPPTNAAAAAAIACCYLSSSLKFGRFKLGKQTTKNNETSLRLLL